MQKIILAAEFKKEVKKWAEEIGVEVNEIHLRNMKRKWASCSSKGRLTFDISLLRKPAKKRVEVILHELLHLKYPNHGQMFKTMLNAYLHDIKEKNME